MTKQELFFLNIFVFAIDCAIISNRLNLYHLLNLHHLWFFFFFFAIGDLTVEFEEPLRRYREKTCKEKERDV